ncbi:hypothetical protein Taro_004281 [Colocasia esculenta]|uniref:Protein EARLY HEADING DATE 2 n=1 Tax=Colocasia esculenta TaxID=4460 RepID=A0A843TP39_COLES|nr:hypothetical protein [Colocasia esculenta]
MTQISIKNLQENKTKILTNRSRLRFHADPTAEVIALSPKTLMATNRFICEICNKGFQRDQNLQLHRRGHNLPWKLRQRTSTEVRKRVYVCPESTCVHHNPSRALGDLTGIKKHFCRKHGEKKWKCDKCAKKYAVQSDLKAHSKTCGTREYKCDCGTVFSRRDSFITHRAFCDALAEENNKVNHGLVVSMAVNSHGQIHDFLVPGGVGADTSIAVSDFDEDEKNPLMRSLSNDLMHSSMGALSTAGGMFSGNNGLMLGQRSSAAPSSPFLQLSGSQSVALDMLSGSSAKPGPLMVGLAQMSATALLQKAAQMGATASSNINSAAAQEGFVSWMEGPDQPYGMRPYGAEQQTQEPQSGQTQLAGIDGGAFSGQFFNSPGCWGLNGMGRFPTVAAGLHGGGGNSHGLVFFKNVDHEGGGSASPVQRSNRNTDAGFPQPRPSAVTSAGLAGGKGSGDMTTVDFLGVGGGRMPAATLVQEQQNQRLQQRQVIELGPANQLQKFQGFHPLQQQMAVYGHSGFEKLSWDA